MDVFENWKENTVIPCVSIVPGTVSFLYSSMATYLHGTLVSFGQAGTCVCLGDRFDS